MSKAPLVGVTGPESGGFAAWLMTALAIRRSGGRPLRITPNRAIDLAQLDAVVIGGGTDVDPLHYDEPRPQSKADDKVPTSSALDWLVSLSLMLFRIVFARHSREQHDPARDDRIAL